MKQLPENARIILSRTDSIGDVILTLPMAGLLKERYPDARIIFLASVYTAPVLRECEHVDEVILKEALLAGSQAMQVYSLRDVHADAIVHVFPRENLASLAKKAGIPRRIGSTGRLYHYRYCNVLVPLSRRNARLHESVLNTSLLRPFGLQRVKEAEELIRYYGLNADELAPRNKMDIIHPAVILHPGSRGSAREWKLAHFATLGKMLSAAGVQVYLTGTEQEGKAFRPILREDNPGFIDMSGKINLEELITFIASADGLVAASTGPLHIAAALGKIAVGIYPPIRPMHPGRWRPLGLKSHYLVLDKACNNCRDGSYCQCMQAIQPGDVFGYIVKNLQE